MYLAHDKMDLQFAAARSTISPSETAQIGLKRGLRYLRDWPVYGLKVKNTKKPEKIVI